MGRAPLLDKLDHQVKTLLLFHWWTVVVFCLLRTTATFQLHGWISNTCLIRQLPKELKYESWAQTEGSELPTFGMTHFSTIPKTQIGSRFLLASGVRLSFSKNLPPVRAPRLIAAVRLPFTCKNDVITQPHCHACLSINNFGDHHHYHLTCRVL